MKMVLIRPRLNDYYNLPFTQEEVDFAIPFLDEDIPLYVDPFLLWKSPSQQDNGLHSLLINSFNNLGYLTNKDKEDDAISNLITLSECTEVGFGTATTKKGLRIGKSTAKNIISLFKSIPQIKDSGFSHFEEIQLYIDQIAKDRISDIACNLIKSHLIDYTISQSEKHNIPLSKTTICNLYDNRTNKFIPEESVRLPVNPENQQAVLFVPKRWLRYLPWINYDDYFSKCYYKEVLKEGESPSKPEILDFNRHNYDMVQAYIKNKERTQSDCKNDPLFKPIPITSAKRKLNSIIKLPTGKTDNADKQYEDYICQLMASLLYPHLDFACDQSRTESGVLIRDLIFYNNRSFDFLKDIYDDFGSRQIVMELKNVKEIEREHIFQLNRYLNDNLGNFGFIITRNRLSKAMFKNTVDLWSGQRKCIMVLTDEDIKMMVQVFESKQRLPIEILKSKFVEFTRACPS